MVLAILLLASKARLATVAAAALPAAGDDHICLLQQPGYPALPGAPWAASPWGAPGAPPRLPGPVAPPQRLPGPVNPYLPNVLDTADDAAVDPAANTDLFQGCKEIQRQLDVYVYELNRTKTDVQRQHNRIMQLQRENADMSRRGKDADMDRGQEVEKNKVLQAEVFEQAQKMKQLDDVIAQLSEENKKFQEQAKKGLLDLKAYLEHYSRIVSEKDQRIKEVEDKSAALLQEHERLRQSIKQLETYIETVKSEKKQFYQAAVQLYKDDAFLRLALKNVSLERDKLSVGFNRSSAQNMKYEQSLEVFSVREQDLKRAVDQLGTTLQKIQSERDELQHIVREDQAKLGNLTQQIPMLSADNLKLRNEVGALRDANSRLAAEKSQMVEESLAHQRLQAEKKQLEDSLKGVLADKARVESAAKALLGEKDHLQHKLERSLEEYQHSRMEQKLMEERDEKLRANLTQTNMARKATQEQMYDEYERLRDLIRKGQAEKTALEGKVFNLTGRSAAVEHGMQQMMSEKLRLQDALNKTHSQLEGAMQQITAGRPIIDQYKKMSVEIKNLQDALGHVNAEKSAEYHNLHGAIDKLAREKEQLDVANHKITSDNANSQEKVRRLYTEMVHLQALLSKTTSQILGLKRTVAAMYTEKAQLQGYFQQYKDAWDEKRQTEFMKKPTSMQPEGTYQQDEDDQLDPFRVVKQYWELREAKHELTTENQKLKDALGKISEDKARVDVASHDAAAKYQEMQAKGRAQSEEITRLQDLLARAGSQVDSLKDVVGKLYAEKSRAEATARTLAQEKAQYDAGRRTVMVQDGLLKKEAERQADVIRGLQDAVEKATRAAQQDAAAKQETIERLTQEKERAIKEGHQGQSQEMERLEAELQRAKMDKSALHTQLDDAIGAVSRVEAANHQITMAKNEINSNNRKLSEEVQHLQDTVEKLTLEKEQADANNQVIISENNDLKDNVQHQTLEIQRAKGHQTNSDEKRQLYLATKENSDLREKNRQASREIQHLKESIGKPSNGEATLDDAMKENTALQSENHQMAMQIHQVRDNLEDISRSKSQADAANHELKLENNDLKERAEQESMEIHRLRDNLKDISTAKNQADAASRELKLENNDLKERTEQESIENHHLREALGKFSHGNSEAAANYHKIAKENNDLLEANRQQSKEIHRLQAEVASTKQAKGSQAEGANANDEENARLQQKLARMSQELAAAAKKQARVEAEKHQLQNALGTISGALDDSTSP